MHTWPLKALMLIPSSTEAGAAEEVAASVTAFRLCEAEFCCKVCSRVASMPLKVFKETIGRSVKVLDHQVARGGAWNAFIVRDKDPVCRRAVALDRLIHRAKVCRAPSFCIHAAQDP